MKPQHNLSLLNTIIMIHLHSLKGVIYDYFLTIISKNICKVSFIIGKALGNQISGYRPIM